MRSTLFIVLTLLNLAAYAQSDSTFALPMKGRIVSYERSLPAGGEAKNAIEKRVIAWLTKSLPEASAADLNIQTTNRQVTAKGLIKVIVNEQGQYYLVNFNVLVTYDASTITLQVYDFFEKPTFPGTTNDWSKIEYRWRDYKKGKPWAATDRALLHGIDEKVRELMSSY